MTGHTRQYAADFFQGFSFSRTKLWMPSLSFNLGLDFLYARVHGWWSQSAHGAALESLIRAATEENFFHVLQSSGIMAVSGPERVLEQFLVRQYERLGRLGSRSSNAFHAYTEVLRGNLERENYKTILNYRFFPERETHLGDALIRFPGRTSQNNDLLALLDATTDEQFIRLFERASGSPELAEVARRLSKDGDVMSAECAIDNLSTKAELAAIARLDRTTRRVLLRLRGCQIDHVNIITLLRNASFHHLEAKSLSDAWMDGGLELDKHLFLKLAEAPSPDDVVHHLPPTYRHLLAHEGAMSSFGMAENNLHRQVAHHAREYFRDASNPECSVAAYPILLELETINLSRIYEGIRFNLPPQDIAAMMII